MEEKTKALYQGKETEVELMKGTLVGDKISTGGMLLDPYEVVMENNGEEIYPGIPDDHPDEEWMYEDEIDEGQPSIPAEDWRKDHR